MSGTVEQTCAHCGRKAGDVGKDGKKLGCLKVAQALPGRGVTLWCDQECREDWRSEIGDMYDIFRGRVGPIPIIMRHRESATHVFRMTDNPCPDLLVCRGDVWLNPSTDSVMVRNDSNTKWVDGILVDGEL